MVGRDIPDTRGTVIASNHHVRAVAANGDGLPLAAVGRQRGEGLAAATLTAVTFDANAFLLSMLIGGVKAILVTKTKSGKGQTITIEETK